jgi:hypothetical protein
MPARIPFIGVIIAAVFLGSAAPGHALRVTTGSFNAVSVPAGGVPTVIWSGDSVAIGSGGGFTPQRELLPFTGGGFVNAALVAAGDQSVIAAEPFVSSGREIRSLGVYVGTVDGSGRAQLTRVLDGDDAPRSPVLAGSTGGDVLLAWNHGDETAVDRKPPDGRLKPPVVAGRFNVEDAAIDGQGNATVIGYHSGNALLVASAARTGRFGPPEVLVPTSQVFAEVAAGRNGQTAVVTESPASGVQLFYRPRPEGSFGPAETIAGTSAQGIVSTAVGDDGRVLVAWTEVDENRRFRLRAMVTGPAGEPTPPIWLSSADRDLWYGDSAAAMNGRGDASAVWEEARPPTASAPHGPPEVFASFRPAGGDFGAAQRVTPPGRHAILSPAIAIGQDPAATVVSGDATGTPESDQPDAEPRFTAARLTSAGLTDVTRLNSSPPLPGLPALSPPVLKADLDLPAVRRVRVADGRLKVVVRCTSWTLDPCRGRLTIVSRSRPRRIAARTISVQPNAARSVTLRLSRAARQALANDRTLRTTTTVTLTGPNAAGSHRTLTLKAR